MVANLVKMQITVRLATNSDLEAVLGLDRECFPPGNQDLEPAPPGEIESGVASDEVFVAIIDNQIVGMLQLERSSTNEWELLSLAITEKSRGLGVGQSLMEQLLLETSKSPYIVSVSCVTSPSNLAMQGLLERYGFVQVGLLADYFGPGKHRLRFLLN